MRGDGGRSDGMETFFRVVGRPAIATYFQQPVPLCIAADDQQTSTQLLHGIVQWTSHEVAIRRFKYWPHHGLELTHHHLAFSRGWQWRTLQSRGDGISYDITEC